MKKDEILEFLNNVKAAHTKWIDRADNIIKGIDIEDKATPVDATECAFGKWFYGDGQKLNVLSNVPLQCMQEMESTHTSFHKSYLTIYDIYFSSKKGGFLSSFFKGQKELSPEEKMLVEEKYKEMQELSKKLVDEIDRLDRRITAISDERIEAL
ncbi:CZB domain-containing protein [Sulfurimonas sp.]